MRDNTQRTHTTARQEREPVLPQVRRPSGFRTAAFVVIEFMIVIEAAGFLAIYGINEGQRAIAREKVAQCVAYQKSLQNAAWTCFDLEGSFPSSFDRLVGLHLYPCELGDEFIYQGGEDRGSEKDRDRLDVDNPGRNRGGADHVPGYVCRCGHDHSKAGVLYVESGAYMSPHPVRAAL